MKTKSKIKVLIFIISSLILTFNVSCTFSFYEFFAEKESGSNASSNVVNLSIVMPFDWYKEGWKAVIEEINGSPDKYKMEIQVERVPGGLDGEANIRTRYISGDVPDLLHIFGAVHVKNNLGGLKNFVSMEGMPWISFVDNRALASPTYSADGKIYGAPMGSMHLAGMLYNKRVFKELGLSIPDRWEDLLEICEIIKNEGITPVYYAGKDSWTLQMIPIIGFNRNFINETEQFAWFDLLNTNKAKFSDNSFYKDSFKKLYELKSLGYINNNFLAGTYEESQKALAEGSVAMIPNATWLVDEIARLYPDYIDDISGFAIPFEGEDFVVSWYANSLIVSSGGSNIEKSLDLVNLLLSPHIQQIYFDSQPGISMVKGVVWNNLPLASKELNEIYSSGRGINNWQDLPKYDTGFQLPKACQDILVGSKTPEELIKIADEAFVKDAIDKLDSNFIS